MANMYLNVFIISVFCFTLFSSWTGAQTVRRAKRFIEYGPDIAGPYCATRRDGCCPGRIDECSVPILDTLCYCDRFCNRTRSDCCPDYFSFCFGQQRNTPPPLRGRPVYIIIFFFFSNLSHLNMHSRDYVPHKCKLSYTGEAQIMVYCTTNSNRSCVKLN